MIKNIDIFGVHLMFDRGFVLLFIVVVKDVLAHFKLETTLPIIIHDKTDSDCDDPKEATNVGKHVVELSILSLNLEFNV